MSYTRRYSEVVSKTVSKTVSVSYPASQSGGSTSVTVEMVAEIPVDVNIHVDTDPFDRSVDNCNDNVNILTGAVVATEAAEIASKEFNSKKVADSIINGFFSYIRSEISQQISELSQTAEANLLHLRELAQACAAKKQQMEGDYTRIAGRYLKTFTDLDRELQNRVGELDKTAFLFYRQGEQENGRHSKNDLVNTVTVSGKENSSLQSQIRVSIAKKRALDSMGKARKFLQLQKKLNSTVQQSMLNESRASQVLVPICFFQSTNGPGKIESRFFSPEMLMPLHEKRSLESLEANFASAAIRWEKQPKATEENIKLYFNAALAQHAVQLKGEHGNRVRNTMNRLFNNYSIDIAKGQ